jgi:hypothetical protein
MANADQPRHPDSGQYVPRSGGTVLAGLRAMQAGKGPSGIRAPQVGPPIMPAAPASTGVPMSMYPVAMMAPGTGTPGSAVITHTDLAQVQMRLPGLAQTPDPNAAMEALAGSHMIPTGSGGMVGPGVMT